MNPTEQARNAAIHEALGTVLTRDVNKGYIAVWDASRRAAVEEMGARILHHLGLPQTFEDGTCTQTYLAIQAVTQEMLTETKGGTENE